ncbi:hypothetical protein CLV78_110120 [Aliiruegeria haliotis]|uniref:Uncharacterized protein n=1 Tax=Aliiruegeria haliotis TaxID=1280846 RepID=A0A2T0RJ85_9RHOB|nr:hypothetical protein [Aliiruegeria haliotis]PRY21245.1 hypothetical protein CLV78_110120 [Aliiruegeria haliotis]
MKILIGALLGGAIVFAVVFFMKQPEPTPEERLDEAAQQAGEAAKDAVDALKDAANDATGALADDLSKSADEISKQLEMASADLSERIASSSSAARGELDKMMADWKATGILTESGMDFDKAKEAINRSELPEDAKSQIALVLDFLDTAPGAFDARLREVEEAVRQ